MFLVIVFKHPEKVAQDKLKENAEDLMAFLKSTNAVLQGNLYRVPTKYGDRNGIELYLKKIEIDL